MALTVDKLREIAQGILDQLADYEGHEEIYTSCNTYRMGAEILETYDGFVNYENIRIVGSDDEEVF